MTAYQTVYHFIADVVLHTGTELLVGTKLSSMPVIQLHWELIAVVPQVICQVQGYMEERSNPNSLDSSQSHCITFCALCT